MKLRLLLMNELLQINNENTKILCLTPSYSVFSFRSWCDSKLRGDLAEKSVGCRPNGWHLRINSHSLKPHDLQNGVWNFGNQKANTKILQGVHSPCYKLAVCPCQVILGTVYKTTVLADCHKVHLSQWFLRPVPTVFALTELHMSHPWFNVNFAVIGVQLSTETMLTSYRSYRSIKCYNNSGLLWNLKSNLITGAKNKQIYKAEFLWTLDFFIAHD